MILKYSKSKLYKTRNLIDIASYLEENENKIMSLHDEFIRNIDGERFSHKKFIDFLIDELEQYS